MQRSGFHCCAAGVGRRQRGAVCYLRQQVAGGRRAPRLAYLPQGILLLSLIFLLLDINEGRWRSKRCAYAAEGCRKSRDGPIGVLPPRTRPQSGCLLTASIVLSSVPHSFLYISTMEEMWLPVGQNIAAPAHMRARGGAGNVSGRSGLMRISP